ncbi:MAG: FtsX-like permease family protein [Burkholderiaceae bacterium]|jgi:putative ABC transport system permease protein|nr:FtsX-like permease family protein [Burkholderiaceae bacterium]
MSISAWTLGWRHLWRDLRGGELRLLMVAVTLAVTALTAVGFFSDRLQGGLQRDARQLLGGDVVVASDQPPAAVWIDKAQSLGLQSALTLTFMTMTRAPDERGGAARLVALKAVPPGYPLRGQLRLAHDAGNGTSEPAHGIPAPGEVWVDSGLLQALALKSGDTLLLGDARLRIARLIALEPDRGAGFMSFAPRVMMNAADLPATGLVQPASRIAWRLALAGPDEAVRRYRAWAEGQIVQPGVRGVRLESLDSGRPEMRTTLDRAGMFLNLVALLAALLSAVAVALAARGFAVRHLDAAAMLRVLGLPQRRIAGAYAVEFLLVGLAASALGVLIGYAVHHLFVALLAGLVDTALPASSAWPALFGLGLGLTLLVAFGLPPVLQLARTPPLRVIRREVGALKPVSLAVLALGVAGFAALLLAVSSDLALGLIAVGGFAGAVLLFALLSWGAVALLRRLVSEQTAPPALALAVRQLAARPAYAVTQVSSLAVGLLALALLVLLRTDLVSSWRAATPPDAPNRFVINIMPDQGEAFRAVLQKAGVRQPDWYPMFRGRLTAINGRAVSDADYIEERARRLVEREFNLSHDAHKPPHNDIVAGRWTAGGAGTISVEQGLADTLGLKLGDTLRFDVAGAPIEARITSLRKVDWASMHVNFFAMFPLADMPDMPVTWIAAFRAPPQPGFDSALVRRFPNITSVDMEQTIAQMQHVLEQVIGAVEFLFGFTLAAGLIVLFATVGATREERAREFAIMRAVGAGSRLLTRVQCIELAGVGLLAGVLAGAVAMAVGWAMARWAFDFNWSASPLTLPACGGAGAALALAAGWWGLREVLRQPVVQTLRKATQAI